MEPILNTFSIAGELTGNTVSFSTRAFSVSPFVPVKYSIPPLPCTTSHFWGRLGCPKLKAFVLELGSKFQAPSQFHDIEVFYFVSYTKSRRRSSFLWPPLASCPTAGVSDICRLILLVCRILWKQIEKSLTEYPVYYLEMKHTQKKIVNTHW